MTARIDSYIGFAVRSGKVVFGLDNLLKSKNVPVVVLYDEQLGQSSAFKLKSYCERNNVAFFSVPENYLRDLLKRKNVGVIAISDDSLGGQIIQIMRAE